MTRADAVDRLSERVGNNTTFWKEKEKEFALREGMSFLQAMSARWVTSFLLPAAGGPYLTVPRQIVSLQRVRYNGTPLKQASLQGLDGFTPTWEASVGTPTHWSPVGLTLFALYPSPTSGTLTLDGISSTPFPLAANEEVQLDDQDLSRILGYGHHYLSFKSGGLELEATKGLVADLVGAAVGDVRHSAKVAILQDFMGIDQSNEETPEKGSTQGQGAR